MANKSLLFILVEDKLNVAANAGKVEQIAQPTGRHQVSFRNFCERVAKSTTFNSQEVEAVSNYDTRIARDIVANGDIIEFEDLGMLLYSIVNLSLKARFLMCRSTSKNQLYVSAHRRNTLHLQM